MIVTLFLVYIALSLVLGGITATIEIWWQPPTMLDRADGRGKFRSSRSTTGEAILFGLFVVVLWPFLVGAMIVDTWSERR